MILVYLALLLISTGTPVVQGAEFTEIVRGTQQIVLEKAVEVKTNPALQPNAGNTLADGLGSGNGGG